MYGDCEHGLWMQDVSKYRPASSSSKGTWCKLSHRLSRKFDQEPKSSRGYLRQSALDYCSPELCWWIGAPDGILGYVSGSEWPRLSLRRNFESNQTNKIEVYAERANKERWNFYSLFSLRIFFPAPGILLPLVHSPPEK
jgi:hypothetical protein